MLIGRVTRHTHCDHLDLLLEKLGKNYDLSRIKGIGGAAQVGRGTIGPIADSHFS